MPDAVVDRIVQLFEQRGAQAYLGEPVTVAQHMLQCAALARSEGAPDALVLAALLHDIGHIAESGAEYSPDDTVDHAHERRGAAFLEAYFPGAIVAPVRLHVAAKRYLCAIDPTYFDRLTPASRHSLSLQGGPMEREAVMTFEREAQWREAVQIRRWDDGGKTAGLDVPPIGHYRPMLERVRRDA